LPINSNDNLVASSHIYPSRKKGGGPRIEWFNHGKYSLQPPLL